LKVILLSGKSEQTIEKGLMAIHKPLQNRRVQRCFNSDHISTASGLRYHLLLTVLPERYLHRRHQTRVGCELLRPGIVAPGAKNPYSPR
jgi:hypothetical protein